MTNRENTLAILRYEPYERLPLVSFGYWSETVEKWAAQGHISREEADDYVPLPGDLIYYHWDCEEVGDCTCTTDHVGIVVGTAGRFIKVIEGNKENNVAYRYVQLDDPSIRGYGVPNYAG